MPLDITEYQNLARDDLNVVIAAGKEPASVVQQVAISGVSTQSNPFASTTRFIRLHTDVACRVAFGTNPAAAGTSQRMAAGQTEFVGVTPGTRVAVISTT